MAQIQIVSINRDRFFEGIRHWLGSVTQQQVDGLNGLLPRIETDPILTKIREWAAYGLATAYHETAHTFCPIEEIGHGRGRPYGVPVNGHVYYGRGYVQCTWLRNYQRYRAKTGIDVVNDPSLMLTASGAYPGLSRGMVEGWYTGKKLANYIWVNDNGQTHADFLNARRIINGMDRADLIAGYAHRLDDILQATMTKVPVSTSA